jgi:hypothetical protein
MCGERVEMCVRYRECYENRIVPALVEARERAEYDSHCAARMLEEHHEALAELFSQLGLELSRESMSYGLGRGMGGELHPMLIPAIQRIRELSAPYSHLQSSTGGGR